MSSTMDDLIGRERREQLEAEANARHDEMHAALVADDEPVLARPYRVSVTPAIVPMTGPDGRTTDHLLSIGRDPEGKLVMGQVEESPGSPGTYRFSGTNPDLPKSQRFTPQRVTERPILLDALSTTDATKRAEWGMNFELSVNGRAVPGFARGEDLQRAMGVWQDHGGHDHAVGELVEHTRIFRAREQANPESMLRDPDPEPAPAPAAPSAPGSRAGQAPTKNSPFAAAFRRIAGRTGEKQAAARPSRPAERFQPRPVVEIDKPSQGPDF